MAQKFGRFWQDTKSSLWFLPSLMTAGAVVLSSVLLYVDAVLTPDLGDSVRFLFGGTAQAARTLLSVVATSLSTVVAVAFSASRSSSWVMRAG